MKVKNILPVALLSLVALVGCGSKKESEKESAKDSTPVVSESTSTPEGGASENESTDTVVSEAEEGTGWKIVVNAALEFDLAINPDKEYEVFVKEMELDADDEIFVVDIVNNVSYGWTEVKEGCKESAKVAEGANNAIKFTVDGSYNAWIDVSDEKPAIWLEANVLPSKDTTWYIAGEGSPWTADQNNTYAGWFVGDAKPMNSSEDENNLAEMIEFSLKAGDKFKIVDFDSSKWLGIEDVKGGDAKANFEGTGNIEVKVDGVYNIYLNTNYEIYIDLAASSLA